MPDYQFRLNNQTPSDIKTCIGKVFKAIGKTIDLDKMKFEHQKMEHDTPKFNNGKMYIYSFWFDGEDVPLKIGKAGPKTRDRYQYRHYRKSKKEAALQIALRQIQHFVTNTASIPIPSP